MLDVRAAAGAVLRGHRPSQALYDWDYPRQLLHLRTAEAAGRVVAEGAEAVRVRPLRPSASCCAGRCCRPSRPRRSPAGAADRRDRPRRRRVRGLPARDPLDRPVTSPSSAPCGRPTPPIVILTSNRTRDAARRPQAPLPVPLGRPPRPRPGAGHPAARGRPARPSALARQVVGVVHELRQHRRPGQAARRGRDHRLGRAPCGPRRAPSSTRHASTRTLGAVVKYREDADRRSARPST